MNRFRLPLSGIPLSKNNIPFQQWEVALGYYDSVTSTWNYQSAYVPQYNPKMDNITSYVFANTPNGYEIVEGQLVNGVYSVTSTFLFTEQSSGYPVVTGNVNYVIVSSAILNNVYVYDHRLNLLMTITTEYPIACIYIDPISNDLYILQYGRLGTLIHHYLYDVVNQTWTLGIDVFTAYTYQITMPKAVVYNSNYNVLYVSDYSTGKIFYWTAPGDVINWFQNNEMHK
ncbi:MAG: hypothetical protein B7Y30_06500 [Campylobacterales bacterium 16-40-21]|nr:MAG: hypothetical protein B7Y30_06500 [Campylobacterales bacterium 16-40-21]